MVDEKMGYIESIRKLVGHQPIIVVGAMVAVFDKENRILMQRQFDNYWSIPGGIMDMGERIEDTAKRELEEESGIIINNLKLIGVLSGPEHFRIYPNGDQAYSVTIIYTTQNYEGRPRPDGIEYKQSGFFKLNDLPTPMNPLVRHYIQKYIEKGRV